VSPLPALLRGRPRRAVQGAVVALVLLTTAAGGHGGPTPPEAPPAVPATATAAPDRPPAAAPAADPAAPDRPPAAAPAADPAAPPSPPVRLQVPAIGVDTALLDLGLTPSGELQVPSDGASAGWFTGAPAPGEVGPAVLAGHVDWDGSPGVFAGLGQLTAGDEVTVTRQDGGTAVFRVATVERHPKADFPTEAVYGDVDHAALRLITCGGEFDRRAGHYDDNVIVFADLVRSAPPA